MLALPIAVGDGEKFLAAIGCVIADLILQYDPQGNYSLTTPAPLTIALWRVLTGSFLGVFCIPLAIAGYWVVCTVLSETAPRLFRLLFWVIAYAIVIGTVSAAVRVRVNRRMITWGHQAPRVERAIYLPLRYLPSLSAAEPIVCGRLS